MFVLFLWVFQVCIFSHFRHFGENYTEIFLCCCCCFARLMWEFYSHHCKKIAYSFKDSAQATAITEVLTVASNWTTEAQGRNFNLTHRIMVLKHKMKPIDQTKSIT